MAAVGVTISGILYDKKAKTQQNVALIGAISLTGIGVGGGPIIPGGPPSDAHPEHPIVIPPTIWPDPPEGVAPHPEHPIVIPPPAGVEGPGLEVQVVWTAETGWAVILVPTGTHPAPSGGGRRG